MAKLNFILPVTLKFEGKFSNDAHDPGGATMEGITLVTFRHYHTDASVAQLKAISYSEVLKIYSDGYFDPIGGDQLTQGVGMVAFDYAVNSGVGAGRKALAKTSSLSGSARVRKISEGRLSFMHGLKTWRYFGPGWGRRVGEVEAIGIRWESITPMIAETEIAVSAKSARKQSIVHASISATASTTTSVGAVPTNTIVHTNSTSSSTIPVVAIIALGAVLIITAIVFGILSYHNAQRAKALTQGN